MSLPFYDKVRDSIVENGTGGLILFQGFDFPGPQIRRATGEQASHVGVVRIAQGLSGAWVDIYESMPSGFIISSLSRCLQNYNGHAWWYPMKDEYRDEANVIKIEERMREYDGTKYDYWDLIKMLVTRPPIDTTRMICSEAALVVTTGITEGPIPTPQGVLDYNRWGKGRGIK